MQNLDAMRDQLNSGFRAARKRRKWTQAELAEYAKESGLPFHASTIAKIEKGNRSLDLAEAVVLARVLEVDLETITGLTEDLDDELRRRVSILRSAEKDLRRSVPAVFEAYRALDELLQEPEVPDQGESAAADDARTALMLAGNQVAQLNDFTREAWNYDFIEDSTVLEAAEIAWPDGEG